MQLIGWPENRLVGFTTNSYVLSHIHKLSTNVFPTTDHTVHLRSAFAVSQQFLSAKPTCLTEDEIIATINGSSEGNKILSQ